ncbi:MAG TPA: hypothetical protein VMV72_06365 [Verrucomicrobiae bacterium]|nr:hypothetical protein [Verrucomicrobiae bacterium]
MNAPSKKAWGYMLGLSVVCLLLLLYLLALRQSPPLPNQPPATIAEAKPLAQREPPAFEPPAESTKEEVARRTDNSTVTNAADLYRQAFALYAALTNDEKSILGDWRTNVDASVESALCEKIRPICDLMHQAAAVTNCDWGTDPIMPETRLPQLNPSRSLARAMVWNAAHCRSNDATGAADDVLSVLQLGHTISHTAIIGCLVDLAIQGTASSYLAQHAGLFGPDDNQRLTAAFSDPSYQGEPSRALEEEADIAEREAARLAALSDDDARNELTNGWVVTAGNPLTPPSRDAAVAALKQVVAAQREMAEALAVSCADGYAVWQRNWDALRASNPLTGGFLDSLGAFADKAERGEVNRALVVAGLAVAEGAPVTLYTDPSSGQPFIYTKTTDGFELKSTYQINGKPMTMQFKMTP